ncbi:MAG: hypothetical protein M3P83_11875 [Actinomycetota bacterium]|nr:hypothetical protein [Actinomycetota bacterium]
MVLAAFKDLCIDAVRPSVLGPFWGQVLGLEYVGLDHGAGRLVGPTPQHTVWVNAVPEPKSVKQRVHLDVHTAGVDELVAAGARVLEPAGERHWTVLADPEGGELCGFVREEVPDYRLYEVVVDCHRPRQVARWWADVLGAELGGDAGNDWWWLEPLPGAPFEGMVFVPVPEPKTVKNRVHWDVEVDDSALLLQRGASLLRRRGSGTDWDVLADPEGNEFCAFTR